MPIECICKPDIRSTHAFLIAEIHGDYQGAIEAMKMAVMQVARVMRQPNGQGFS